MSKNKYVVTRVQNRKPYNFKNIIQKDDGGLYINYEEKIITQLVKSRDEDEFKTVCSRIQDFIEKENIDVCFVINQDELVDCLTEHQKLKLKIADLEHRLVNCIEPKFKQGDYLYSVEKSGSQIFLAEGYVTTITQLDDGSIWYHLSLKPHEFGVRENTCYKTMDEVHEVSQKLLKEIDDEQNNRKS